MIGSLTSLSSIRSRQCWEKQQFLVISYSHLYVPALHIIGLYLEFKKLLGDRKLVFSQIQTSNQCRPIHFLGIETGPHVTLIDCVHHGRTESLVVIQLPPYSPDSGSSLNMTPKHMAGVEARTHVSTLAHEQTPGTSHNFAPWGCQPHSSESPSKPTLVG